MHPKKPRRGIHPLVSTVLAAAITIAAGLLLPGYLNDLTKYKIGSPAQKPSGPSYCKDNTGTLGEDAAGMNSYIESFTGREPFEMVTTLENIDRGSIEDRAVALFKSYSVGAKHDGRGILAVIVPESRTIRLEVGYALEEIFTDAFCSYLAQNFHRSFNSRTEMLMGINGLMFGILSRFHANDDAFMKQLLSDWEHRQFRSDFRHLSGGGGATIGHSAVEPEEILDSSTRALFCAQNTPDGSAAVLRKAVAALVKDPDLDIYTPMTRIERSDNGWDFFSSAKYLETLTAAGSLTVHRYGRFAVVKSEGKGWPLFFVQGKDSLWRFDEVRLVQNSLVSTDGNLTQTCRTGPGREYIHDPYIFDHGGTEEEIAHHQRMAIADENATVEATRAGIDRQLLLTPNDPELLRDAAQLYLDCNATTTAYMILETLTKQKSCTREDLTMAAYAYADYPFLEPRAMALLRQAQNR